MMTEATLSRYGTYGPRSQTLTASPPIGTTAVITSTASPAIRAATSRRNGTRSSANANRHPSVSTPMISANGRHTRSDRQPSARAVAASASSVPTTPTRTTKIAAPIAIATHRKLGIGRVRATPVPRVASGDASCHTLEVSSEDAGPSGSRRLLGVAVLWHRSRRWALALPLLMAGTGVLQLGAKWAVDRPRPNLAAGGFPSGHVLSLVVFSGLAIYLLRRSTLPRRQRWLGSAGAA